jgi:CelD/BcsL family acetyltransferase involved in cellulose biosynthesis
MRPSRSVDVCRGPGGLEQVEEAWRGLVEAVPTAPFYVRCEWYAAYLRHLESEPERVLFLVLRESGDCRGLVVLRPGVVRRFGLPLPTVSVPMCKGLDLSDCLLAGGERLADWLPLVWRALGRAGVQGSFLRFPRVPDGGPVSALASALPKQTILRAQGHSCYFDCQVPPEQLSAAYSTRLKKILRKGERGLAGLGEVRLRTARSIEDLGGAFREFERLEASGWKGQGGTASALRFSPRLQAFHADLFNAKDSPQHAEINLLVVGEQAVAAQLCMISGGVRSLLKIAFEQSLERASPGSVLLDMVLRRSCEDRTCRAVSLVTGQAWMADWGAASVPVSVVWALRGPARAALARAALSLIERRRLRGGQRRVP